MGTLIRVTLHTRNETNANRAIAAAKARFEDLDASLSDYKPDSELNRFCRAPHGIPTRLSDDLFSILTIAQRLSLQSRGAFDVTIGARTRGRTGTVGYQHLALGNRAATLLMPRMQLDLGGIAKGYAADRASDVLREHGQSRHLVAASGDIRVWDPPPGMAGWAIGLGGAEQPSLLKRSAVSTSGNTFQPGHIVDPRTLEPVIVSETLTIVADACAIADGLATACMVLKAEERAELLSYYPSARLIARAG